jgi:hypothetical protein
MRRTGAETHCHMCMLCIPVSGINKMQLQLGHCEADVKLQSESAEASVLWKTMWMNYTFVLDHCELQRNWMFENVIVSLRLNIF